MKKLYLLFPLLLIVGCSKPISEETLIDKDGLYTEWYENGNKKLEYTYNDGKMDGLWTWWWEWTGDEKKFEKTYKDGNEIGKSTYYNEDGSVREVKDCDKGECDDY